MKKSYGISGKLRKKPEIRVVVNGVEWKRKTLTEEEYLNLELQDFHLLKPGDNVGVTITWEGNEVSKSYTVPENKICLVSWDIRPIEKDE